MVSYSELEMQACLVDLDSRAPGVTKSLMRKMVSGCFR